MTNDINLDVTRPIIFAADVHLKPQWSTTLPAVVEDSEVGLAEYLRVIQETNAAAIILGGDIFDANYVKHLWLQQLFFSWVDQVLASGCQVLAYPGNHDYVLHQLDPDHPVHIHSIHPGVIDIDGRVFTHGTRRYGCIGHCDHPGDLLRRVEELGADFDTLLLHQLIVPCGGSTNLDDLPEHIRTIILGDVHEFADGTTATGAWWGYPGCMFPQNVAETDHGVFVVAGDPNELPMRKGIVARSARHLDINDEIEIDSQLTIAVSWVNEQRRSVQQLIDTVDDDTGDCRHLEGIMKPVVQLRVARNLVAATKKAVAHSEVGDLAHVQVQPISVPKRMNLDIAAATKAVPAPIDLLPAFVERLNEHPQMRAANCPYPAESAALVRELLLSGGAGRKAGDDARRADGKPLAHGALIAAALADVGEGDDAGR